MYSILQGVETGCVTTLGRGGSDLTATALGKALGLQEIQVSIIHQKEISSDFYLLSFWRKRRLFLLRCGHGFMRFVDESIASF